MGCESTFNYSFYPNSHIKDLDRLNKEIVKLDSGMGDASIVMSNEEPVYYEIDMDSFYGKFYDDEEFAELLSKYLTKGYADLIYTGEDGAPWGFRVYPDKVKNLEFTCSPVED